MVAVYEDNFGFWEIDGPEERAFLEHVGSKSVPAICQRCKRSVQLMPPKILCARCVCAIEYGAPALMRGYDNAGPK